MDRNFYPRKIEFASIIYRFMPRAREDSRDPDVFFFYICMVFFSPFHNPAPHASAERTVGAWPCARNLNPLVIKSGLYATAYDIQLALACGSRTFTHEKVKYIQVGYICTSGDTCPHSLVWI